MPTLSDRCVAQDLSTGCAGLRRGLAAQRKQRTAQPQAGVSRTDARPISGSGAGGPHGAAARGADTGQVLPLEGRAGAGARRGCAESIYRKPFCRRSVPCSMCSAVWSIPIFLRQLSRTSVLSWSCLTILNPFLMLVELSYDMLASPSV
jgi:hypothetical protein